MVNDNVLGMMPWKQPTTMKGGDDVLTFFIGLFVGGIVGVFTMCLFQINKE